jgi:hypothetical protein
MPQAPRYLVTIPAMPPAAPALFVSAFFADPPSCHWTYERALAQRLSLADAEGIVARWNADPPGYPEIVASVEDADPPPTQETA